MAVSSEYRVNIIVSSKDQTSQGAKAAGKSLGGLAMAAKLAAAGYIALKVAQKGLEFVKMGADVQRASSALNNLAMAAGQSGQEIISAIQEASDFTIDKMTAMQVANKAMLMGVAESPKQFRELAHTATILGRAMGLDAVTAIDRFVVAAGRKSVKVADDLGLLIDASKANEDYAKTLGKTVEDLTAAEQSQAFLNAMTEAAEPKVAALTKGGADLATSFEAITAAAKDAKDGIAVYAAEQASALVPGKDFNAWLRSIPDFLREQRKEFQSTASHYTAYRITTEAVTASALAQAASMGIVEAATIDVGNATFDTTGEFFKYKDAVSSVSYIQEGYKRILQNTVISQDAMEKTILDTIKAIEDEAKATEELKIGLGNFVLDASMQWTSYYRDVEEQGKEFILDREKLEAQHQVKIENLRRQGQARIIQVDEEAELAKLAGLQNKLDIALQSQAEFTEKTKLSTRMRKDAEIAGIQESIAAQTTLLDDYYGGRLVTAGKNVDALIVEENRRHQEAIAGLEEEIAKTQELQRQQLGTLLLQTFETWAEIKDIPPDKMLEMRTAIAKEYGLISAEEAQLVGLSIKTWDQWAVDFSKSADQVTTELGINIQYVQDLQTALDDLPSEKVIDIIIRQSGGSGLSPEYVAQTHAELGPGNVSNTTYNTVIGDPANAGGDPAAMEVLDTLAEVGLLP